MKGRWYLAPERVELDVELARTGLDEITALMRGYAGGIHGTVSSRLHLAGPLDNIGIAGRLTVEVGPGDRGEEAEPGVTQLHREVAPERQVNSGIEEPVPRVGAGEACAADTLFGPRHVAGGVGGLHRCDDSELREAGNIGGVDDLGVRQWD
jgi:hypothetical protein